MITEDRASKAMEHLTFTDISHAEQRVEVERQEILRKRVRARIFLSSDGSIEARKAKAETHEDTCAQDTFYISALLAFEKTKASRERADLVIRLFQTVSANQRKG